MFLAGIITAGFVLAGVGVDDGFAQTISQVAVSLAGMAIIAEHSPEGAQRFGDAQF